MHRIALILAIALPVFAQREIPLMYPKLLQPMNGNGLAITNLAYVTVAGTEINSNWLAAVTSYGPRLELVEAATTFSPLPLEAGTALGQIAFWDGAKWTAVPAGTSEQVLYGGTVPQFQTPASGGVSTEERAQWNTNTLLVAAVTNSTLTVNGQPVGFTTNSSITVEGGPSWAELYTLMSTSRVERVWEGTNAWYELAGNTVTRRETYVIPAQTNVSFSSDFEDTGTHTTLYPLVLAFPFVTNGWTGSLDELYGSPIYKVESPTASWIAGSGGNATLSPYSGDSAGEAYVTVYAQALGTNTVTYYLPTNLVPPETWGYADMTNWMEFGNAGQVWVTGLASDAAQVIMNGHLAASDPHAGKYLSPSQLAPYMTGAQTSNLVQAVGGGVTVASHGVVLGDSTVAAYAGGTAVASLLVTAGDRLAGNSVTNLAVPGHTIAQQFTAWTNYAGRATSVWVAVQVGLNDLLPAANVTNVVADYQALVNRIRADAPTAKVLVATMTPAKQRYIDVYGSTGGAASYTWWLFLNTAIMGGGTHPVTNVDMRVSSHTDVLNDGAGNLASVYDTGDHVHENTAARTVIAAEWRRALNVAGLLPASASSWYRDTIVSEKVNALDTRLSTEKLDVEDGTAYRLVSRQGMTFYENSVRLFPAWTNGVPVLAVSISGTNYVFNLQTPLNFSETAPAWYDALALDSVWPVDEGAGTNLVDAAGSVPARTVGGASWSTFNGAQSLALDGSGYASIGDAYDPGTNSFMFAAWFAVTNTPSGVQGIVSKNAGSPYEIGLYIASDRKISSIVRNNAGGTMLSLPGPTAVDTGTWHHVALVVTRGIGSAVIVDGQTYASSTNHIAGWDLQSSAHTLFGYRGLANSYLVGHYGSMQIDIGAAVSTNTAVNVWNASRTTYGR